MNPSDQMKVIQEAAGECRHQWHNAGISGVCLKCRVKWKIENTNPSPDDLNELVRLARKATDLGCINFTFEGDISDTAVICWLSCNGEDYDTLADSPADALRLSLVKAIEGRK